MPGGSGLPALSGLEDYSRKINEACALVMGSMRDFALFLMDPSGIVASWNGAAEQIFGYTSEEIIGQSARLLFTEEARAAGLPEDELRRALETGGAAYENWLGKSDHGQFWGNGITSSIRNPQGQLLGYVKVVRDSTEEKRAQDGLREAEERLRLLADAMPALVSYLDSDRRYAFVNRAYEDWLGVSRDSIIGKTVKEVWGDDLYRELGPRLDKAYAGESLFYEARLHFPTGDRWIYGMLIPRRRPDGKVQGLYVLAPDISAQKKIEQELRAAEERLKFVLEQVPVAVWTVNERLEISFCQGRPFGHGTLPEASYFIGKSLREVQTTSRAIAAHEQALTGKTATYEIEVDGTCYQARVKPLLDGGHLVGVAGAAFDISERKKSEVEIQALNEQLEERVRERTTELRSSLKELETFAYTVAHDLRAPLRAIAGFCDILRSDFSQKPLDPVGQDYADRAIRAAQRMDVLIGDLLNYSRLTREEVELESVDLGAICRETLEDMRNVIEKVQARVEVVAPLPRAYAHPSSLKQAISNLLSNALKFVAPGTFPRISLRAEDRGETLRLWVEDNGIGIAPEYRDRIFGIFQRLYPSDEVYPGTGIGLAIVKRAMERMDGAVGFESAPGKGSRFYLELPKFARANREHPRHPSARSA